MSRDKLESLYLHLHKTFKYLNWHLASYMFFWSCGHVMLWKNGNATSPPPQDLQTSNLTEWWFRRGKRKTLYLFFEKIY